MPEWSQILKDLQAEVVAVDPAGPLKLAFHLVLGGIFSIYIRWLFRRFSATPSDSDSVTRVFPLLTLVTTGVIAVVKSSLALSLGLVGALSIVRFRAAIKEPEELVYLFLCIAVGLSLGSEQPWIAVAIVAVATVFIVGMSWFGRSRRRQSLMLTITADVALCFKEGRTSILESVEKIAGGYTLQRFDVEGDLARIRLILPETLVSRTGEVIAKLRTELPGAEVSLVNIGTGL